MNYLLTLTFPTPVEEFDRARELVTGWLRTPGARRVIGSYWCLVAELHPGGHGWHLHLARRGRPDALAVKIEWTRWLLSRGFDRPATANGLVIVNARDMGSPESAARYLAKYLVKQDDIPAGRHRYEMSAAVDSKPVAIGSVVAASSVDVLRLLVGQGMPTVQCIVLDRDLTPEWDGPPMVLSLW